MAAVEDDDWEIRLCSNCKKEIPAANFITHEIHCSRNIGICPTCKEAFPKPELKKHYEKEHVEVFCRCGVKMERENLKAHAAFECVLRLVTCQFCDIELAFTQLHEHEDYCGARTERCRRCRNNIMLKDLKEHPEDCDKMAEAGAASQPKPVFGAMTDARAIQNIFHPAHANEAMRRASHQLPEGWMYRSKSPRESARRNNSPALADPNQARAAEAAASLHFHQLLERDLDYMLALSLQQEHGSHVHGTAADAAQNEPHTNAYPSKSRIFKEPGLFPQEAQEAEQSRTKVLLPCEFCEELCPEEMLIQHQTGCNPATAMASYSKRGSYSPDSECVCDLWEDLQSNQAMGCGERPTFLQDPCECLQIPCEFCGVLLDEDILFYHQNQCHLRPGTASSMRGMPALEGSPPMESREESEESDPELPQRQVHTQGATLPPYFEDFRAQPCPPPCQGALTRNNLEMARRMQQTSHETCYENSFGSLVGEKPQGSEPSVSWGPSKPQATIFPLSSYKPSFPEAAPTRPSSLRNKGGRNPAMPTYYKAQKKLWVAEAESEDESSEDE